MNPLPPLQRRGFIEHVGLSLGSMGLMGMGGLSPTAQAQPSPTPQALGHNKVELFAHRGASALRPEHTLAAYVLAIRQGADYIEPDLVSTKDGVLVARHENNLTETTDVATRSEFAHKKTKKNIDGLTEEGWFVEDFKFDELKKLRAIERLGTVRTWNNQYNGMYQIPSFEEIIELVAAESAAIGRPIGLVPEIKHSTYHQSIGLKMEDRFMDVLRAHPYLKTAPLEIQSFEVSNLKYMREKLGHAKNLRIMQLVSFGPGPAGMPGDAYSIKSGLTYEQMLTPKGLKDIAQYADVVAPNNRMVIPLGADQRLTTPTRLVADAHEAGLKVHTWTFRPENRFLAAEFRNNAGENSRNESGSVAEMLTYIKAGIDGFFSDDSALGRQAIEASMVNSVKG